MHGTLIASCLVIMRNPSMWMRQRSKFGILLIVSLLTLGISLHSCKPELTENVNEYRIGCMLPLSDVASHQYGVWAQQGIDLATEEINQKGGIGGKKLVIDYQDDLGTGDQAVKIMSKFTSV